MERLCKESWVLICVVGAFAAGLVIANYPFADHWKPGWEMLSAVGTIGAVGAALWLAGQEGRTRKAAELQAAELVAIRLHASIVRAHSELTAMRELIIIARSNNLIAIYEALLQQIKRVNIPVNDESLGLLSGLDNVTAFRLASALSDTHAVTTLLAQAIAAYATNKSWMDLFTGMTQIQHIIEEAIDKLEQVGIACDKVGRSKP